MSDRRGARWAPTLLAELGLVAVMAEALGLSFGRVFGGADLRLLAVVPALGAVLVAAVATGARGWSPSGALLASLGVGLVVATVVAWREVPTPAAVWRAADATPAAPSRVLSAPLPAPDRPELLVLVAGCTWVAAHAAAELVLRVRSTLLPLVPFVVGVAVPLVLGAGGRRVGGGVLGTLTAGAAGLVLVRAAGRGSAASPPSPRSPRSARPAGTAVPPGLGDGAAAPGPAGPVDAGGAGVARLRRRRALAALPVVALAGALPLVGRDHLPLRRDEPRFDPRGETRGAPPDVLSPLVEVGAQRSAPESRELFVAETTGDVELWRLAVLDTFDGAGWRSSATFAPVGSELPRSVGPPGGRGGPGGSAGSAGSGGPGSSDAGDRGAGDEAGDGGPDADAVPPGDPVRQEITLGALDSPFLPVAGRAVELEGPRVRFDPAGGVVLAERPPGEGTTYAVDSVVVQPTEEQLGVAGRDRRGPDTAAARQPVPEAGLLADVAIAEVTNRSGGLTGSADVRQLRALQEFFADQQRFRLAPEPVSGLSLRHLTEFVRTALEGGPSEGSIEQFAAAYAVMARTLGFPTRVVAGYRTVEPDPDGRYHVDAHDAFAWTEVKLDGLGWVPFVAAPIRSQSSPPTEVPTSTTSTTLADRGGTAPTTASPDGGPSPDRRRSGGGGSPWPLAGALAAALALVAAGAGPVRRGLRRWRRSHQPGAVRRIDGAWRELLDRLAAHQVPVTGAMTATEVLGVTTAHVGAPLPGEAHELATLVNAARFGPGAHPPDAASAAWRATDRVTRWVAGRVPPARRLRAWLDPRARRL